MLNTHVIRPYSVNFLDFSAKCHSFIDDELYELMRCRLSSQEAELFINGVTPGNDDPTTNLSEQSHERKVQADFE
jgi:hypothetical protein